MKVAGLCKFGVGFVFGLNEDQDVIVLSILPDTPAASSPIEVGDYLLAVGPVRLVGRNVLDVRSLIQGDFDSEVSMTLQKPAKETYEVLLRRTHPTDAKKDPAIPWLIVDDGFLGVYHDNPDFSKKPSVYHLYDLTKTKMNWPVVYPVPEEVGPCFGLTTEVDPDAKIRVLGFESETVMQQQRRKVEHWIQLVTPLRIAEEHSSSPSTSFIASPKSPNPSISNKIQLLSDT